MFRSISLATLTALALSNVPDVGKAQTPSEGRGVALFEEQARFDYCTSETETCPPTSLRTILVFRANTGGTDARNRYYLEPALLPIAWELPSEGWPSAFNYVERTIGGQTSRWLQVRVLSFSAELQELAENVVRASPTEAVFVGGGSAPTSLDLNDIIVHPLEMREALLEILSVPENEVLATSMPLLGNAGSARIWEFSIPIEVAHSELQRRLAEGNFAFRVRYDYFGGQTPSRANLTSIDRTSLSQSYSDVLDSRQIGERTPISQSEREEIAIALQSAVAASVTGNDYEAINLLIGREFLRRLETDLFQGRDVLSLDEFRERRGLDSVEDFLEPLYSELREMNRENSSNTASSESRERRGFDVRVPAGGARLGLNLSQEQIERTGSQHGVEFLVDEESRVLIPHNISVSYIASRHFDALRTLAIRIQVDDRAARSLSRSEIIPATMVVAHLDAGVIVPSSTVGVPVGAAICSFAGTNLPPRGFRWIAAGSSWPDLPVFGRLRGTAMPSMNSMLLGSTERVTDVGTEVWGTIRIPERRLSLNRNESGAGRIRVNRSTILGFGDSVYVPQTQWQLGGERRFHTQRSREDLQGEYVVVGGPLTRNRNNYTIPDPAFLGSFFSLQSYSAVSGISMEIVLPGYSRALNDDQSMPRHLRCRWMVREY